MSNELTVNNMQRAISWTVLDHENDTDLLHMLENTRLDNLSMISPCNMDFCSWEMPNLSKETSNEQDLDVEYGRLRALKSYSILEANRDPRFERITALASRIFSVPIALVSLVDMGRQWFLSNRGLGDVRETPRNLAFCAHAILSKDDLFIVNDATKDERFRNSPLVTSEPHIRFYAGAPLVDPEGFKLGTLCIIDSTPRPDGLSLMEKQNLRELAGFVVDTLVERKKEIQQVNEDKYKIIACTAHDLLTPLFGIELNLSLLMDDGKLWRSMSNHQKDLVQSACSCTEMMSKICHDAINTYRGTIKKEKSETSESTNGAVPSNSFDKNNKDKDGGKVTISRLVQNLKTTIDSYPKRVPVNFEVAQDVPPVILSDDVKLFRSALNYLTNACKVTKDGSIIFRVFVETLDAYSEGNVRPKDNLVFEVDDSGPGININDYPGLFLAFRANNLHQKQATDNTPKSIGLGLSSVASNISSLGGDYGFTTKNNKNGEKMRRCHSGTSFSSLPSQSSSEYCRTGSIFWFSIPIDAPSIQAPNEKEKKKAVKKEDILKAFDSLSKSFINEGSNHVPNTIQIDNSLKRSNGSLSAIAELTEPQVQATKKFSCTLSRRLPSVTKTQRSLCQNKNKNKAPLVPPVSHTISVSSQRNEEEPEGRKREALIIDDSVTIRKSIDRALKNLGFEVSQAENGMIGLQCLKSKCYDLVFCDFLMPIMDGLDCVNQFRTWEKNHRPDFKQYIIGISAHASPYDANCGLSGGMNMFLTKPLKLKTIKELVVSEPVLTQSKILDEEFLCGKSTASASCTSNGTSSIEDVSSQQGANMTSNEGSSDSISKANSEVINHVTGPVCLIAEDSKVVGKSLVRAIEKRGYRSSLVENGEDALRLLKMRNWDIVFLDEQMPLLSGSSCVARFRTWELRNRVVRQNNLYLLSGSVGNDGVDSNFIIPSGFDGAFGKPFKVQELYELLESEEVRAQCDPEEIVLRY